MSDQLIDSLFHLKKSGDTAALARLRRALMSDSRSEAQAYPYVIPYLSEVSDGAIQEAIWFAGLFAVHPSLSGRRIGRAIREAADRRGSGSLAQSFESFVNSSRRNLPRHLKRLVMICKSDDIQIDWRDLYRKVQGWDRSDRSSQRDLALEFWSDNSIGNTAE